MTHEAPAPEVNPTFELSTCDGYRQQAKSLLGEVETRCPTCDHVLTRTDGWLGVQAVIDGVRRGRCAVCDQVVDVVLNEKAMCLVPVMHLKP